MSGLFLYLWESLSRLDGTLPGVAVEPGAAGSIGAVTWMGQPPLVTWLRVRGTGRRRPVAGGVAL